jgi:hypothetical protein
MLSAVTAISTNCPAWSAPLQPAALNNARADGALPIVQVRVVVHGGAVGPRGGAAVRRTAVGPRGAVSRTAVRGPRGNVAVRNTAVVNRGGWARPARYHWPVGGAIAAGAAIGFVTAATAVAWAGVAPAPGMCWYYSDPSRTQGFWDYCPQ